MTSVREMRERYQSSWLVAWLRVRTIRKADEARARRVCAETLAESEAAEHYRRMMGFDLPFEERAKRARERMGQ